MVAFGRLPHLLSHHLAGALGLTLGIVVATPAIAQLIPDATLGAESSVVTPGVPVRGGPADLIEGGAPRGGNLFHSFDRFDIFPADRVYFANPAGVDNILTRVTGPLDSLILGTLGVDGAANLFLLNPNGVYFGPDVQLDIAGSLLVSTANRFTLADGSEFNALPLSNELLSMSVPLGVQFNEANPPQGNIRSEGNLTVGGDLTLLGNFIDVAGEFLFAATGRLNSGGNLTLRASNDIRLLNTVPQLTGETSNERTLLLEAGGGIYLRSSVLLAVASRLGDGGAIVLRAEDIELTDNTELVSYVFELDGSIDPSLATPAGAGGPITLDARQRIVMFNGQLNATSLSIGERSNRGGDITLKAGDTVAIFGSRIANGSFTRLGGNAGDGGAIKIEADNDINLIDGVEISSFSFAFAGEDNFGNAVESGAAGNGGPISLMAGRNIQNGDGPQDVQLFSFAAAQTPGQPTGNGGEVVLVARDQISGLQVLTVSSSGNSGDVSIEGRGDLRLQNVSLTTNPEFQIPDPIELGRFINIDNQRIGPPGNTSINSIGTLTLDNAFITSVSRGSQPAGSILIEALGEVKFIASDVNANAFGQGRGGDITVRTPSRLTLENFSRLLANTFGFEVEQDVQIPGRGGNILIETPFLAFTGESFIGAGTFGEGSGGDITVQNPTGSLLIRGDGIQPANFGQELSVQSFPSVQSIRNAGGRAGLITILATDLTLENGLQLSAVSQARGGSDGINLVAINPEGNVTLNDSSINASTTGQGAGGGITVTAPGDLTLNTSSILASTSGEGSGGSIALNTSNIDLSNGGQIAASTSGEGNGGSIIFNPGNTLNITGQGGEISVETSGTGRAGTFADARSFASGNFSVAIPIINIDGVTLSASTTGPQAGGDVNIRTSRLTFANGGEIAASTSGPGNGGNVTVTGNSPLTLQGNGRLTVEAVGANSGRAGNLNVRATDLLRLRNGVELSVTSESERGGGNINIDVKNGSLAMSGGSFINATSTNASAGDGGNITLRLSDGFLIGAPGGNTDIIANAVGGNGGNINISALRLFGFSLQDEPNVSRLRGNNTNDISASSQVGLPGSIALDTLALDPSQGLTELPLNLEDRADQIAAGCGLGNTDDGSEFVVTGRGGLPPGSSDPLAADGVNVPWVMDDGNTSTVAVTTPTPATTPLLVEADGVAIDADGNAYFVAQGSAAAAVSQSSASVCRAVSTTH